MKLSSSSQFPVPLSKSEGIYLGGSILAEATVLGGKESKPAGSTLPALGSENALSAGEGMLI